MAGVPHHHRRSFLPRATGRLVVVHGTPPHHHSFTPAEAAQGIDIQGMHDYGGGTHFTASTATTATPAVLVAKEPQGHTLASASDAHNSSSFDADEAHTTEALLKFVCVFIFVFCCVVSAYGVYANVEAQEDRNGERRFVDKWFGRLLWVAPRRSRNTRNSFSIANTMYGAGRSTSFQDRMTVEERTSLQELKEAVMMELDGESN